MSVEHERVAVGKLFLRPAWVWCGVAEAAGESGLTDGHGVSTLKAVDTTRCLQPFRVR